MRRPEPLVLISDPRVAAVQVADCGEPLLDLREDSAFVVDDRLADPAGDHAHLRAGLVARLRDAQQRLPDGLRLLIVEGYRSLTQQQAYFDEHVARHQADHPSWSTHELRVAASEYVSPPDVAPHSTGGALDLTLMTPDGTELDMGTAVNEVRDGACHTAATSISAQARANRDILSRALTDAGLVNYPTEWWHWSYGERYWAITTGAGTAVYGPVRRS